MRTTRRIIPFALLSGLLLSCGSEHRLARVRISQPGVREATTDTACKVPEQIAWTDDKGERHIVTRAEKDSVTGEEITSVELSEITVMARSKQVLNATEDKPGFCRDGSGRIGQQQVATPAGPGGLQAFGYVISGQDLPFRG